MLVYIAGPYTHPEPIQNTRNAIDMWYRLWCKGITAIVPHNTLLMHLIYPLEVGDWYAYDLELLAVCTHVLRLPGLSAGADRETERAHELGIPIVHTIEELLSDG